MAFGYNVRTSNEKEIQSNISCDVTGISAFSMKTKLSDVNIKSIGKQKSILDIPPAEEWSKTFGGAEYDDAMSVQQTIDGGYIVLGTTRSYGAGKSDIWLIKIDSNGNEMWNKTFGGPGHDMGRSVRQTSDGGYIIFGDTLSFGTGFSCFWLIKTDSNGKKEWDETYGGILSFYEGWSVQQTNDGGYIIIGTTGITNVKLIKTDSEGKQKWEKTFTNTYVLGESAIQQTSDDGYIIVGAKITSFLDEGIWLLKTDSNGNKLWEKTYGGKDEEHGASVRQTFDGGYIIIGETGSYDVGVGDFWLIKTNSDGNKEWDQTFGGTRWDEGWSVDQTQDGGYILTGETDSYCSGKQDIWLIKTDNDGNKMWHKTFGGADIEYGYSVQQTSNGGYIVAGYTASFGAGQYDAYLIKTSDFENQRPDSITFAGPTSGKPEEIYEYMLSATEPDGEDLYYLVDWDDGNVEEWIGPYNSDETIEVSHTWSKKGTYNIRAKAMDIYGGESEWAELVVTMPRNKAINGFFLRFLEQFPILQKILCRIL